MEASRASVTDWIAARVLISMFYVFWDIYIYIFNTTLKMCPFSDPGKLLHTSTLDKLCHQNCMAFYSSGEVYLIMGACSVCWLWCCYQGSKYPKWVLSRRCPAHHSVIRFVTRSTIKSVFTTDSYFISFKSDSVVPILTFKILNHMNAWLTKINNKISCHNYSEINRSKK